MHQNVRSFVPGGVLVLLLCPKVIIDVQSKELGIPTKGIIYNVEEVKKSSEKYHFFLSDILIVSVRDWLW